MSIETEIAAVVSVIKADLSKGMQWVEGKTAGAVQWLWGEAEPIFTKYEPLVVQAVGSELATFLTAASADVKNGTSSYIAQTFLATLRDTGHVLLADTEAMGEDLLTVLAGLAKVAAAKV